MYEQPLLCIDGVWREGRAGRTLPVLNPADESLLAELPLAASADLEEALDAAGRAFAAWRRTTAFERAAILSRTAALIAGRKAQLAELMTLEQGKPLAEAAGEIDRTVETFQWFAEEATRVTETRFAARPAGFRQQLVPEPLGVVAAFTAWNFPSILVARKLAPALAAGCTVILKAAEETPASAVQIVKLLQEAGLPDGVVNLVFGVPDEVSGHLLGSPLVRKLSFTGSVPVGKLLAERAAKHLARCTLELGGHAPAIVLEDADVEQVAAETCAFKFRNAGQVCITISRFYVHEAIHDAFLARFTAQAEALTVGDGRAPETQMGPLANARRLEAISAFVTDALDQGARLACGGQRIGNRGYFWAPTVLSQVPERARVMTEEPFGPLAPVAPFSDTDEVLSRANGLDYGLAAYVFGGDQAEAERVGRGLEAGIVGVNRMTPLLADTPAGGVKASGIGYEGGHEGLAAYQHKKLMSIPS